MSFFKRLFAKLFGRKKQDREEDDNSLVAEIVLPASREERHTVRVPHTPMAVRPPYPTTAKFQQVSKIAFPKNAYEYPSTGSGHWYVPQPNGLQAGPFVDPAEYYQWLEATEVRDKNLEQWQKETDAKTYTGYFNPRDIMRSPEESAFVYAASILYFNKHSNSTGPVPVSFWYGKGLFNGKASDIAALINYGEQQRIYTHKNEEAVVADFPAKESELYWRVMAVVEGK